LEKAFKEDAKISSVRFWHPMRNYYSGVLFAPAYFGWEAKTHISAAIQTKKGKPMKKMLLSIALVVAASLAWGQTTRQPLMNERETTTQPQRQTTTTQTTSTTEATGTITEYTPGSAIALRETSGPVRYRFGKTVTYVTRSGRTLDEATVRSRIRVGVPVRVHYTGTAPNMVVDRVILEED
jgi:hypothetical protein